MTTLSIVLILSIAVFLEFLISYMLLESVFKKLINQLLKLQKNRQQKIKTFKS